MLPSPSPRKKQKPFHRKPFQSVLASSPSSDDELDIEIPHRPGSVVPFPFVDRYSSPDALVQGDAQIATAPDAVPVNLTSVAPASPQRPDTDGVLITYETGPEDSPSITSLRIEPALQVLKDICANAALQRPIRFRNDRVRYSNSYHARNSLVLQAVGYAQYPPCEACAAGYGPFEICVAFRGICDDRLISKGACANCLWTGHAVTCSFHPAYLGPVRPRGRRSLNGKRKSTCAQLRPEEGNSVDLRHWDGEHTTIQSLAKQDAVAQKGRGNTTQPHDTQPHSATLDGIGGVIATASTVRPNSDLQNGWDPSSAEQQCHAAEDGSRPANPDLITADQDAGIRDEQLEVPNWGAYVEQEAAEETMTEHIIAYQNDAEATTQDPAPAAQRVPLAEGNTQGEEPKEEEDSEQDNPDAINATNQTGRHPPRQPNRVIMRQKKIYRIPEDFQNHKFILFPNTLNPHDADAIERALAEARSICRRLEKRLSKLRNVSWDDV